MEHPSPSCTYNSLPNYAPCAFQSLSEEQGLLDDGYFVGMLHDSSNCILPPTPTEHITYPDWCAPCVPDYLVSDIMLSSPPLPPPSPFFYEPVESSGVMTMDVGNVVFTPPPSPPSVVGNEFLMVTEAAEAATASVLPFLPPSSTHRQSFFSTGTLSTLTSRYRCEDCNKSFTRPYNLKSHMRTHTNERPFACTAKGCSWKFARPHDLKRHELLHSGKKPHKCSVCTKQFARRDALRRHWKVDRECGDVIEGKTATRH